jgi:hypothetical protein
MRKLLVGMISVALCVVFVSSIAFATTYWEYWSGDLFYGQDYLDVLTPRWVRAYAKQVTDNQELGCHVAMVTLYKGGSYEGYKREPEVGLSLPAWIHTCLYERTTLKLEGSWEADLGDVLNCL